MTPTASMAWWALPVLLLNMNTSDDRSGLPVSSSVFCLRMPVVSDSPISDRVHGIAALDHPLTLASYRLLAERGEISREAAADALEVARSVAAFHLDKLVDNGLADVRFERLTGRTGPGAGRTAKLYRRSDNEIEVSLPERRYDLAGELLAQAVEHATTEGTPIDRALFDAATEAGRRIGVAISTEAGSRASRTKRQAALV